ncbi:MAG: Flp pilus assembly protein CpaB, partial [Pseudomonadota bacterium]
GGYLALALQPRMRAVGVQISEAKTAGGFIMPNDRVDVLLTVIRDVDGDGAATGATRTVLTNVRVLAVGSVTFDERALSGGGGRDDGGGDTPPTLTGKTATLEVSPEQAEALLSAAASGQISLALRASEDFGLSGFGDLAMIEGDEPPPAAAPPPVAAPVEEGPSRFGVTIISSGAARTYFAEGGEEAGDE